MRSHISVGLVVVCALILGAGCDDGMMRPGGGRPGTSPDAGTAPDAGGTDGGGTGSGFVSNTPGATVVDIGQPPRPGAVLISSNVLQEPSRGQVFQQWIGEVKNIGSTLLCFVHIDVALQDTAGATVATFSAFAYGAPYMVSGLTVSVPCIAPGQIGSLYDNGFVASSADLTRVTRIAVRFSDTSGGGVVPAPHAPQISSHVEMSPGESEVAGTLTGVGGPVYAIAITAFPRDPSGLSIAYLFGAALDTLQPGAVVPFHTIGAAVGFTDYRQFVDFIDGVRPAVAAPSSPEARQAFDRETMRRAQDDAVRARLAQARGQR